ncbi:helix-turn-helix transcriptional regulator [Brevibacillus porteri]|uniref:helix-turn-helix transcriptional regulator n=1 Tax=Brevibacillus porteri TaxID=2126350 RepID=UPI003626338D
MNEHKKTLREWRAVWNLTKQEVAKRLKVHPSTYAKWESKPEDIKISDAVRLAAVFQCKVHEINFFEIKPNFNLEYLDVAFL